ADIVPHYPESLATVAESLYEVAPTFVFTVPRYLQKFAAHLLVGIDASTTLKRAAYHAALRLGARAVARGATALPGRDEGGGVWGRLARGATALPGRDEGGGVWGRLARGATALPGRDEGGGGGQFGAPHADSRPRARVPLAAGEGRLRAGAAADLQRRAAAAGGGHALAGLGREPVRGVRPDGDGRRPRLGPARAVPAARRRRSAGAQRRGRARRRRRAARARSRSLRGLLARPRGDVGRVPRRLAAHGRRSRADSRGCPPPRRPAEGPRDHRRRQERQPVADRDGPAREPLRQRRRRLRRGPQVPRRADRDGLRNGRRVGARAWAHAHRVRVAGRAPGGDAPARRGDRARERVLRSRGAGEDLPCAAARAGSRAGGR